MELLNRKSFSSPQDLAASAAEAILSFLRFKQSGPRALMLSGGRTPLAAYDLVAESGVPAPENIYFFLSDERIVAPDSAESNYRNLYPFLASLAVSEEWVIRVETSRPIDEAAELFHTRLKKFFDLGGRIPLGFLGLGTDGHTASLFSKEDVERGEGRYAIAVERPSGPARVSVTPELLRRIERIIFLVTGEEKRAMVDRLLNDSESIPAGLAVRGHGNVEVWFAE